MEELILNERKFKENLVELINNSNLPAVMIKPIIKEAFEQINILEQQQYQAILKDKEEKEAKEKSKSKK